ncbi:MAG: hypoxanthine phosphoribosyltransferase [Alistipes sp.]|nr:hypoxanthine phosphoribosyltransferase [Candidatus Alistipes equi]
MENKIKILDKTFKPMIPAKDIDKAIDEVAQKLNADYSNTEQPPILVGILNGAVVFLTDLIRKVNFLHEIAFLRVSSYEGTNSTGNIKMHLGLEIDITNRDVIIVEDIVDTGSSIDYLIRYIQSFSPKSVNVCSLFFKPEKYRYSHEIKYPAMNIGNEFIVGFGLDYDQLGRNLKDIYVVCDE